MDNVTVITLGPRPAGGTQEGATFEEAFGEYSEARGRGRARRKKRRLERISNRKEVRAARREEKKERKVGRQQVKQAAKEARIEKRRAAQQARQEKRTGAMEMRQKRKIARKGFRIQRREMGDGPEAEMDDQTAFETGQPTPRPQPRPRQDSESSESEDTGMGAPSMQEPQAQDQGGYAPSGDDQGGYAPSGDDQGGYQAPSGGGSYQEEEEGEEWGGAPPVTQDEGGAEGDEWGGEGSVYTNDNDDSPEAEGTGSDFDGVLEDNFSEFNDIKINPKVANLANKLEWNKELVSRLRVKKAELQGKNKETSDIDEQISARLRRIANLEAKLNSYATFDGDFYSADAFDYADGDYDNADAFDYADGDYDNADGDYDNADGDDDFYGANAEDSDFYGADAFDYADGVERRVRKRVKVRGPRPRMARPNPKMVALRNKEIAAAKLAAIRRKDGKLKRVTPVSKSLHPEFSKDKIVIPAETGEEVSNANGFEPNYMEKNRETIVTLSSNAEGDTQKLSAEGKKVNWKAIAIGVGIAAVAIWAIRKYKVFEK